MLDAIRIARLMLAKRREYRRNAGLDPVAYQAMKLARFRRFAAHAAARSPYYRDIVQERGIDPDRCTPDDFPVLTKSLLMAHFDRIVTDPRLTRAGIAGFLTRSTNPRDRYAGNYRVIHTSGSSGEMGYFVYSPLDWVRGTGMAMRPRLPGTPAFDRRKRRRKGRIRVALYAAVGGHFAGVTMISAMNEGVARTFLKAELFEVNAPMADTVAGLNAFQPDIVAGYTGALLLLARQQQAGNLAIAPQFISTSGEGMSPADKAVLEATFGGIAVNGYGSSEHLMMGTQIPGGTTMLLYDDDLVFDMQADCTLVTNLFNETLPLIRYRMADVMTPVAQKTFPHLPYPEIRALIGRSETTPVFRNADGLEDSIHPITIAELFVSGVQRFQMRWQGEDRFTFLVVPDPALDAAGRAAALAATGQRLQEMLDQKRLGNVRFAVKAVEDLAVNPQTRKFQLIVDERQPI